MRLLPGRDAPRATVTMGHEQPVSAPLLPIANKHHHAIAQASSGGIGGDGLGIASLGLPRTALALLARALQFPRDFGSHPDLQTEWWYITGQLQAGGKPWGFS